MIPVLTTPRFWLPLAAGAAILAAVWWGEHRAHENGYQEGYDKAVAEATQKALAAEADARQREQALRSKITENQKESSREKALIARQRDAALASLRDRPERPAGGDVPTAPGNSVACTGAQLYRSDAGFLVGEAARADQLRIDLQACQATYDAARGAMTKINNTREKAAAP